MTSLNDIANSVYLLKMRLNRVKGAEDELLARGTQHKQTRTGGTGNVSGKMSLNTGSADRDKLQRDTSIFPKPHNRKMDRAGKRTGDKIPMTGTAGVGGEKQTFNPAGSKTDRHRTAQGEISSSGVLGSGKERKTKPTSSSPGYYMDKRPGKTRTISAGKKPKGSGRRLYTDENPKDTVGIKFATPADARKTVAKVKKISKPFARKIQILTVGEQRAKVMGKTQVAAIFKKGKEAIRRNEKGNKFKI